MNYRYPEDAQAAVQSAAPFVATRLDENREIVNCMVYPIHLYYDLTDEELDEITGKSAKRG